MSLIIINLHRILLEFITEPHSDELFKKAYIREFRRINMLRINQLTIAVLIEFLWDTKFI